MSQYNISFLRTFVSTCDVPRNNKHDINIIYVLVQDISRGVQSEVLLLLINTTIIIEITYYNVTMKNCQYDSIQNNYIEI